LVGVTPIEALQALATAEHPQPDMPNHTYRETLKLPGLQPFLWTQFLGAFNDNVFKIVVSLMAVHLAAGSASGRYLSLTGLVFILPFLLFSGYAGRLADLYSKRTVLIVTKSLEIVTALLALAVFVIGRTETTPTVLGLALAVLFLFALQSTFFSPAKYGILPEMLPDRDLSRANGVLEMSTFVAIVTGTALGTSLLDVWSDRLWLVGLALVAIAVTGTAASFGIPRVAAAAPRARVGLNPWSEIRLGLARLLRDRVLWLTVVGISYFWFLGALFQLTAVLFGAQVLKLGDQWIGLLTAFAAVGIGVGSLVAGRLSGDKVELGLAPFGAIGMGVFAILLSGFVRHGGLEHHDGRLLRRPVCGPAERLAPAAERRAGARPPDGDEQFPEHGRHHARLGCALDFERCPGHGG
jgi:acyl-[acyl-carrier-protein]-phospholipid O-acyltransferase/long-chain-fatty-acid--[acyl-carrier-protein] ligase